jgi:hypothetical protein
MRIIAILVPDTLTNRNRKLKRLDASCHDEKTLHVTGRTRISYKNLTKSQEESGRIWHIRGRSNYGGV